MSQHRGQWTTGLFGCFDDCGVCCLGYMCAAPNFSALAQIQHVQGFTEDVSIARTVIRSLVLCINLTSVPHATIRR